ncbi:MAG TPA: MFS transporter [Streptosporangiaceae bacterium]
MTATGAAPVAAPEHVRRGPILAVILIGAFMILLDGTIVNVALVPIQRDLAAGYGAIEWAVGGYALAYGLLLIPSGRLADRFGHRRLLMTGLAGFTAMSALCGLAVTPGQLVAVRVLQGVAAGVLNAPILAIIQAVFPPEKRGGAFAAYGATAGVSTALGPIVGGLLITWDPGGLGWRSIFLINLPIGVAALVATARVVPESYGRGGRLDLPGVALVAGAVLLVTFPLVQGRESGWPWWTWACLAAAVPVLAAFVVWERRLARRGRDPLIDMRLFGNRAFSAGVALSLVYFAAFIGLLFALSVYLQAGLDRPVLAAGLTITPFAVGTLLGSWASESLAERLGRRVLLVGAVLVGAGIGGVIAAARYAGPGMSAWHLLPGLLVGGVGSGFVIAPNVGIVLSGVPWRDAGSASGVLNTAQRVGQAIGVAVVGVALFGAVGSAAPDAAAKAAVPLRAELAATGMGPARTAAAADGFARCFALRSRAADPSSPVAGCPEATGHDPVARAYARAAATARADAFTDALQPAAACALGGIVLTFLLVFALPRRTSA